MVMGYTLLGLPRGCSCARHFWEIYVKGCGISCLVVEEGSLDTGCKVLLQRRGQMLKHRNSLQFEACEVRFRNTLMKRTAPVTWCTPTAEEPSISSSTNWHKPFNPKPEPQRGSVQAATPRHELRWEEARGSLASGHAHEKGLRF